MDDAAACVVVGPGTPEEREVPIRGRLVVGRGQFSDDDPGRLVIEDAAVSRNHLEIRLDTDQDRAWVIDMSTNGTRLNGSRIERASPVPLAPGDRLLVGSAVLEFRSERFLGVGAPDSGRTMRVATRSHLVMVVGDIASYSTITQVTDSHLVSDSLEIMYGALREVLTRHRGTLADYAGDAMFAIWDLEEQADAAVRAVEFTLDAVSRMDEIAQTLPIRAPDGSPVRLGWAVVEGTASVSSLTGALIAVVGDATNLAFRLSGLAGREGRPPVIVTDAVRTLLGDRYAYGQSEDVATKGRTGDERIVGVLGRS
jgi:class 3 adenylate cyclase